MPKRFSKDRLCNTYKQLQPAVKYLLSGFMTDIFAILIVPNLHDCGVYPY